MRRNGHRKLWRSSTKLKCIDFMASPTTEMAIKSCSADQRSRNSLVLWLALLHGIIEV